MAYTPTLWAKGDIVTSEKLNKIEQGIVDKVDKVDGKTLSTNDFTNEDKAKLDGLESQIDHLESLVGSPLVASTAAEMTDEDKVYVYTGSETGYQSGNWYYYNGTSWVSGGVYNSVAFETDDTLSTQGMAADAKKTGDEISALKEELNATEDKLIDGGIIADYLKSFLVGYLNIEPDGGIRDSTGTSYQLYAVEVEGRNSIIASEADVYGYYSSKPALNSVAMDGVRHFSGGTIPFTISIPSEAKYVAIRVASGTVPTFSIPDPQPLLSDKVAQLEDTAEDLKNITDNIAHTEYTDSVSVLEDGTVTADYYLTRNGDNAGPYAGVWEYISFDVNVGEVYSVKAYAGQLARLWLLLNSNGGVVSYSQDDSAVSLKTETVTIPSGVAKMIVNAGNGGINVSVNKYSTAIKVLPDAVSSNILAGKVLCCAGDSITYGADMDADGITNVSNIKVYNSDNAGNFTQTLSGIRKTWGYQIAERNGMTLYNAGVSGSTMQGLTDKNGFSLANGRYTKLPDNIDYLLLWFGWNDTAYGTLGAITDTTNESYYGGYNVVLPYLINKYPYAKIALIVPFGTDAGHRNAIRQLGNKWGVAVWDNYQGGTPLYYGKEESVGVDASIETANRAKFQANGAHPNYRGHKQLADMIEEFLRGI